LQNRSAARSKLHAVEPVPDSTPPMIASMLDAINRKAFKLRNTSTMIQDFPGLVWHSDSCRDSLAALEGIANYQTQVKWAMSRLHKNGEDTMVSEITNKKFYTDVKSAFAGLDSRVARDDKSFFIKFPPEHAELKKVLAEFQIVVHLHGYYSVNVTPFCLPEVQACTSGEVHLVGVQPASLDGDTAAAKVEALTKLTWPALEAMAMRDGFACTLKQHEICAIPAGLFLATVITTDSATIIRYSVVSAEDYDAAHSGLVSMLQSYSYLASTDYATVKALLEAAANRKP